MNRALVALFVLATAVPTQAQQEPTRSEARSRTGWLVVVAGALVVAGAFDYNYLCDGHRSTDWDDTYGTIHLCTTYYGGSAYTRESQVDIDLARKPMLYAGFAAIGVGVLLATVGSKVPVARDLDIGAGPGELFVGKTFGF